VPFIAAIREVAVLAQERFGVHAMVHRWVAGRPDALAVREPSTGTTLTYHQLWERSGRVSAVLTRRGIGRGDVVAVTLDRSADLVVALLGVLRCGAAYLPLDAHAPAARIAALLREARVALAIGEHEGVPEGLAVPMADLADASDDPVPVDPPVGRDDPCYVMHTSGSTGTPKGVVVPHRAVVRLVARPHYCVVAPGDRCANGANPAFDATTFELWGALTAGATVVVMPSVLELTIDQWVALVRAERIDTMFLTTSLFHAVARERPDAFESLGNLVVGGEQLEIGAVRRVLESGPPRRLVNGYGPTETTTFAAYFDCTTEALAGLDRVPVGFPLQDTALHVLDERAQPVPPGETGELCVGGPGVALGYLGLPEATAEKFIADPVSGDRLYRTGDLARLLPSGAVELLGRRDRQVKLRGFRIELEEIERSVMKIGLCDAVVVEKIGSGPTAFLVGFILPSTRSDRGGENDLLIERVTKELAASVPSYMVPARWVTLGRMPFGPTGKVDRDALLALLDEPRPGVGGPAADLGPLGEALRQIWQDVLDVPSAAAEDNFLDLGGNSVMAMQVATRVRHRLDLPVEPADVLLADSLGDLVRQLGATAAATS
jgi:amino acid adenylation domain-containing protein